MLGNNDMVELRYRLIILDKYLSVLMNSINTLAIEYEEKSVHTERIINEASTTNLYDEDDFQDLNDEVENKYFMNCEYVPNYLFSSFVMACYSFMEQKMFDLCRRSNLKITFSVQDNIKLGKGIFKIKSFLKYNKIFDFENKDWQEILYFNKLRNHLVHNGNEIECKLGTGSFDKNSPIYKICGMETNLVIDNDFHDYLKREGLIQDNHYCITLLIDYKYCKRILDLVDRILYKLIDLLNQGVKEHE